jgi:hypothetical protein
VQPYGQSSFINAGQVVQIVIPQMQRTFLQNSTGYLTGTITYAVTGTVNTDKSYVLGSLYSIFSRQVLRSNSQILETIEHPGRVVNALLNMSLNPAEKIGLANSFGFAVNDTGSLVLGNIGPILNINSLNTSGFALLAAGTNNTSHSFSLPLIGCMNTNKFFPCFLGETIIELTVSALTDYVVSIGVGTVTGFTISNLEYVVETIELTPESFRDLMQDYPGEIKIKTESYLYGSSALGASSNPGSYDIPFQAKLNSLKRIIMYVSPNGIDKNFGGVNPNLDSWQFISNGTSYPQRPIKAWNVSECYNQVQKSQGSLYSINHSGCMTKGTFNVCSTAAYATTYPYWRLYDSAISGTDIEQAGNKHYYCLDVETVNNNKQTLYNGISTSGTSSFIRFNVAEALAAQQHVIQWWAHHDKVLIFDLNTQEIRSVE